MNYCRKSDTVIGWQLMLMNKLEHFFAMGGYAYYVWPAYGFAVFILLANLFIPVRRFKQLKKQLKRQQQHET